MDRLSPDRLSTDRLSPDPVSRATDALTFLLALAQKGGDPGRLQRETASIISGWLSEAQHEDAMGLAREAVMILHDQLATGIEQSAEMVDDLDRDDAPGIRAGERLLGSLRAALEATMGF